MPSPEMPGQPLEEARTLVATLAALPSTLRPVTQAPDPTYITLLHPILAPATTKSKRLSLCVRMYVSSEGTALSARSHFRGSS
jgi:hypothetical protein